MLIDRDAGGSKTLAHDVGGLAVLRLVPDVPDEASWEASESAIRDRLGALSEAVVNAGVAGGERLIDMSLDEWRDLGSYPTDWCSFAGGVG